MRIWPLDRLLLFHRDHSDGTFIAPPLLLVVRRRSPTGPYLLLLPVPLLLVVG